MKKAIVLIAMLVLAVAAFAQQSYVSSEYKGDNTPRLDADKKLGFHDVLATATGDNPANATQRNGCQSCHVPHTATQTLAGTYLWKYNLPSVTGQDGNTITLDAASFHTLACLSCHDGTTASDVFTAGNPMPSYAKVAADGLMNDHPVNQILPQHGATPPTMKYVRLYAPAGFTKGQVVDGETQLGYVECGSCHDPHMGDANTYDFLRGPKSGTTYAQTDSIGAGTITYTGTSPQWARLGLCRDCHGK